MVTTPKHLRFAIADDHTLVASAIKLWLGTFKSIHVTGIYGNGQVLLDDIDVSRPDFILMDIRMPVLDGIRTTEQVHNRYPKIHIIAMSSSCDGYDVKQMIDAGAKGYLTKDMSGKDFEAAIDTILSGGKYVAPHAAEQYALYGMEVPKEDPVKRRHSEFSPREVQVIRYIAEGMTDKEIAKQLSLSAKTVEAHKRKVMIKIGVNKSTEIVSYAYRTRLIS
jgi:DNA-binding NarL/FixJ family response regulator